MLPIVATLAGAGLDLLASVIKQKGKEVIEKKFGVEIPNDLQSLTPEKIEELRKLEEKKKEIQKEINQLTSLREALKRETTNIAGAKIEASP